MPDFQNRPGGQGSEYRKPFDLRFGTITDPSAQFDVEDDTVTTLLDETVCTGTDYPAPCAGAGSFFAYGFLIAEGMDTTLMLSYS